MTLLDIIQIWNMEHGVDLDNITDFFDDIVLDNRLSKEILAGVLLDECGAMESVYNTTPTFKYFSELFFKKYQWNITKLTDSLNFQYDPLKNKNLNWTETTEIEQNLDTGEDTSEERSKDNTGTRTSVSEEDEVNTISAMNSSSYEPDTKRETDGTVTNTDNLNESITASKERTKTEDLTWDETDTHTESGTDRVLYQDLIEKERRVSEFSVYGWIAKKYAHELFLLVY